MEKEVGLGSKKGNSGDIQREDCPTSVSRAWRERGGGGGGGGGRTTAATCRKRAGDW